jgi:cell division protein FtsZ
MMQAEQALQDLVGCVDTVIVIPNERLMETVERGTSFFDAFRIADDILRQAVQGISDIITVPGIINRDVADVKTIMSGQGYAVMGTAVATGATRATDAAMRAISSPLLEDNSIQGAQGILINISGSNSLTLHEVHEASSVIQKAAHENANIIFGAVQDEKMGEELKITVIATGFRDQSPERRARMLSVEEAPVFSVPMASFPPASVPVSVPLVAPDNWMHEPAPTPAVAPPPPRFMSQDEEPEEEAIEDGEPAFYSASDRRALAVSIAVPQVQPAVEAASGFVSDGLEPAATPARPQFAELAEAPAYATHSWDHGPEIGSDARGPAAVNDHPALPASSLFSEPGEEAQRDLDTPTFMRRLRF